MDKNSEESNNSKYSFDSKLYLGVFFIPLIFLLILTQLFENFKYENHIGLVLFCLCLFVSFIHKLKHSWVFPKQSVKNILKALRELIIAYSFLVSFAVLINPDCFLFEGIIDFIKNPFSIFAKIPNNEILKIMFSLIIGFGVYKALLSLRVVVTWKRKFEAQCNDS